MTQTIRDSLVDINTTKGLIRNAIVNKGVDVPTDTPFRRYADKIAAISQEGGGTEPSGDGWTRPADRPAVPTVNPEEIYMLFGVIPTGPNDYAITLTAVGGYRVDWGDGTIETIASAVKCQHMYDYTSLAVTPNADGIKWVWIKFTPVSGVFTVINTNVRHSLRPAASVSNIFVPQVYEIYMNAPNVTTWAWGTGSYTFFRILEVIDWQGINKLNTCFYFMYQANNLQRLNMYTGNVTNFSNFLRQSTGCNPPINIDTSKGTNFSAFMYQCYAFNQPINIDTGNGTDFSYFMYQCYAFNQPISINTSNGKDFTDFVRNCYTFNQSIEINLASASTVIGTGFIGTANFAQTGLRLLNMGSVHTALTISNSSLGVAELVALFNDLYDRSSTTTGSLTITNVFGASQLTQEQRNIAINKNWNITG